MHLYSFCSQSNLDAASPKLGLRLYSKGTYRTYMSFRIEYRTQTLGVPNSLKDPHITRVLGTPGPHIPSDMGLPRPHITRDMGTGVPILRGPHFTQTPVVRFISMLQLGGSGGMLPQKIFGKFQHVICRGVARTSPLLGHSMGTLSLYELPR